MGPIASIQTHELIAVDASGYLCACGDASAAWLEHLATVTLDALNVPPLIAHVKSRGRAALREDRAWLVRQQIVANLESFRRDNWDGVAA